MIGRSGERGSGISVLAARHDDGDDDDDELVKLVFQSSTLATTSWRLTHFSVYCFKIFVNFIHSLVLKY